jgi:hypothetical protein
MTVTTYRDGVFELSLCAPFLWDQGSDRDAVPTMAIPGWESQLSEAQAESETPPTMGIAVEYYQLRGSGGAGWLRQKTQGRSNAR